MSYSSCGEAEGGSVASCGPAGGAGGAVRTGDAAGDGVAVRAIGTGVGLVDATVAGGALICGAAPTCGGAGAFPATVDKSSGAPAARPPGAPIGGPLSCACSGAA